MRHILLFDSGCSTCSRLAKEIGQATNDLLETRSLNDAQIQKLLDEAHPGWQWRPMLLELTTDDTKLYQGLKMNVRLVRNLGIRRAFKLARIVMSTYQGNNKIANSRRRHFLQQSGFGLAAFALLTSWPKPQVLRRQENRLSLLSQKPPGELYEGFVLLPDIDSPVPDYVQAPSVPLGDGKNVTRNTATFESLQTKAAHISFPLYALKELPEGMKFTIGEFVEALDGKEVYTIYIVYTMNNSSQATRNTRAVIVAQHGYPQPFPIWPSRGHMPQPESETLILPEKTSLAPRPGILLPNAVGYQLHWLRDKVAYTLLVENTTDRKLVEHLARSLAQI